MAPALEQGLDMLGLPEGKAAFARGDDKLAHGRTLFVLKKEMPGMLAWALPKK
jgi:hypothetical protein